MSVRPSHYGSALKRCKLESRNLHCGCSKDSSFSDSISCPWVRGFPMNESVKEGTPFKRRYFAAIGSFSVKTVAYRYRHAAYHNKHWRRAFYIYQYRWPWMTLDSQKKGFWYFLQFLAATYIPRVNCDETPEDRPRQPANEIFSIKRRF